MLKSALAWCGERWNRFRVWQRTPVTYPALDPEEIHTCVNCGELFTGKYCPRCGQNGRIRRLNMKGAMEGFMDVWGLGSRSMPRAMLHLLTRPGYMIGDYIQGHRQAYFPPFKMLFLLTAAALLVAYMLPDKGTAAAKVEKPAVEQVAEQREETDSPLPSVATAEKQVVTADADEVLAETEAETGKEEARQRSKVLQQVDDYMNALDNFGKSHKALSILLYQLLFTVGVWVFFRKSPRFTDISFPETFIGQTMIASQMQLLSIIYMLVMLRTSEDDFALPMSLFVAVLLIDFKQLYGYNWLQTILRTAGAAVVELVVIMLYAMLLALVAMVQTQAWTEF